MAGLTNKDLSTPLIDLNLSCFGKESPTEQEGKLDVYVEEKPSHQKALDPRTSAEIEDGDSAAAEGRPLHVEIETSVASRPSSRQSEQRPSKRPLSQRPMSQQSARTTSNQEQQHWSPGRSASVHG